MIECKLQPVVSKFYNTENRKPRYGVYLQTMYWGVKGYGKKNWVVSVKIELDYDEASKENSDEEIVQGCIEYLNAPQKSKYGKRRMRKPLYSFSPKPYSYEIVEKNDKKIISARLITTEQKNKNFWNTGPHA